MSKILIIEDNPVHNLLVVHIVEDLGHEPLKTYDVDQAKEIMKEVTPDMFIIDMNIKESRKSTIALIQELQKSRKYKKIPIIIISAYVTKADVDKIVPGFNPDHVVEKPADSDTIIKKIKELLGNHM